MDVLNTLPSIRLLHDRLHALDENELSTEKQEELQKFKLRIAELISLIEEFNATFSNRGWVAYDSLNEPVMKKVLEISRNKGVNQAEEYLVNYYDERICSLGIASLFGINAFRPRLHLLKLAFEDYICGRYHSCIPILLMMTDGVVADAGNNLGFFSEKSDVTAWDSISGHEKGLKTLKEIFYKSRPTTQKSKITLPYRNGILHGRDLGYANKEVAAKCWALLFTIKDVLKAQRDSEINKKKYEVDKNKTSADIQKDMQHLEEELREAIIMSEYKRASGELGIDIPINGSSDEYSLNTPERALVEFLELWKGKKYGPMSEYMFLPSSLTKSKMAGRLRKIFDNKDLLQFTITDITDLSACRVEIIVLLEISLKDSFTSNRSVTFRLFHCELNTATLIANPTKIGRWKIVEDFYTLSQIGTTLDYLDDPN